MLVGDARRRREAMVDFTRPTRSSRTSALPSLPACPSVVGTTGWDTAELTPTARRPGVPVFYAPNFAIGAVLMMRFAEEASRHLDARRDRRAAPRDEARRAVGHGEGDRGAAWGATCRSTRCGCPGLVAHQEVIFGGRGQMLTIRHDTTSREAFVPGRAAGARAAADAAARRDGRPRRTALRLVLEDAHASASVELTAAGPSEPEALIDEEAFAHDEFLPYWAELGRRRSRSREALPDVDGAASSSSAAASVCPRSSRPRAGREVTATDWAADAIELLRANAARNGARLDAAVPTGALRRRASTSCSRPTSSTSAGTSNRCSRCCRELAPTCSCARRSTVRGGVLRRSRRVEVRRPRRSLTRASSSRSASSTAV